jgi:hypothetical protein
MNAKAGLGMRAAIVALATGLAASVASADLTDEVFTLHATAGGQSGVYHVMQEDGWYDDNGNFFWILENDVNIKGDNGEVLATLSAANISIFADPVININFHVQASNQNTIFQVTSGLLSFPDINNAIGAASAGVTVTDVNGNGATLAPDGDSMYRAHYNGLVPAGTLFTTLLEEPVSAGAFNSASGADEYPGGGNFVAIGETVESMSARWTFSLSAFDIASGTSTYVIIPTPAGAALLGFAGLAASRRRR